MFVSKKNVVILCFDVKAQFQKEVKKRKKLAIGKLFKFSSFSDKISRASV